VDAWANTMDMNRLAGIPDSLILGPMLNNENFQLVPNHFKANAETKITAATGIIPSWMRAINGTSVKVVPQLRDITINRPTASSHTFFDLFAMNNIVVGSPFIVAFPMIAMISNVIRMFALFAFVSVSIHHRPILMELFKR